MDKTKLGCVYTVTCTANNKIYVGQTISFKRRVWEHFHSLKMNKHKNCYMQQDYNTYGESSFVIKCIQSNLDLKSRRKLETHLIQQYGGIESDNVYNFQDNITENTEMRKLVSDGQKGKIIPREVVEKMRKTKTGRKLTEEHKAKIRANGKRFVGDNNPARRPEVRAKISEKVSGTGNGMYNKRKYNAEFIQLLRDEYNESKTSYTALAKKYNMSYKTVSCLIQYGETFNPNTYYKYRKFKDYPGKE